MGALFLIISMLGQVGIIELGMIRLNDNETGLIVLFVGLFVAGLIGVIVSLLTYQFFLSAVERFEDLRLTGIRRIVKPSWVAFPQDQNEDQTS